MTETSIIQQVKQKPKKSAGIWIYPELPKGMHPATIDDIFTRDLSPRIGRDFIIESMVQPHYFACYKIRDNFQICDWIPWYNAGKMYFPDEY